MTKTHEGGGGHIVATFCANNTYTIYWSRLTHTRTKTWRDDTCRDTFCLACTVSLHALNSTTACYFC